MLTTGEMMQLSQQYVASYVKRVSWGFSKHGLRIDIFDSRGRRFCNLNLDICAHFVEKKIEKPLAQIHPEPPDKIRHKNRGLAVKKGGAT